MAIEFHGWWNIEDKNTPPATKMRVQVLREEPDDSDYILRDATEEDLFRAGFTTQALALDEVKKRNKEIKQLKGRHKDALERLQDLVKAIKEAQEEGFTFEEFSNPEGVQEALEQAEELLVEEDMDI